MGRWERGSRGRGTYVYLWLIFIVVWQKPAHHCKAIILHKKRKMYKTLILSCLLSSGVTTPNRTWFLPFVVLLLTRGDRWAIPIISVWWMLGPILHNIHSIPWHTVERYHHTNVHGDKHAWFQEKKSLDWNLGLCSLVGIIWLDEVG